MVVVNANDTAYLKLGAIWVDSRRELVDSAEIVLFNLTSFLQGLRIVVYVHRAHLDESSLLGG